MLVIYFDVDYPVAGFSNKKSISNKNNYLIWNKV